MYIKFGNSVYSSEFRDCKFKEDRGNSFDSNMITARKSMDSIRGTG